MCETAPNSFLTFFNTFNTVVLLIDPTSAKIINANKCAIEFYGYPLKTLIGMPMHKINTLSKKKL